MGYRVKDREGLLAVIRKMKGCPKGEKGVIAWLAGQVAMHPSALGRTLAGTGLLPTKVIELIKREGVWQEALRCLVEVKPTSKSAELQATMAFRLGREAFEHLAQHSAEADAPRIYMLVFSCRVSHVHIGEFLRRGCDVELLVSDPGHWKSVKNDLFFRETMTVFHNHERLHRDLQHADIPSGLTVSTYQGTQSPFRGLLIDECGIAIGPYIREDAGANKFIFGHEQPAVVIGAEDPAFKNWSDYFHHEFNRLRAQHADPAMTITSSGVTLRDDISQFVPALKA